MAGSISQYTLTGTVPTFMGLVPPGASASVQNTGTQVVYVGVGTGLTATSGYLLTGTGTPSAPYAISNPPTAQPITLYGLTSGGTGTLAVSIASNT